MTGTKDTGHPQNSTRQMPAPEQKTALARVNCTDDPVSKVATLIDPQDMTVARVPVDRIRTLRLLRDRQYLAPADLDEMMRSLRDVGLQNPIRVEPADLPGRFELIHGHRRLAAYRAIYAETGDMLWAEIPAIVQTRDDDVARAYRRMIDENAVRREIPYAEYAQSARTFADDPTTEIGESLAAVDDLFRSANAAKRAHIKAFVRLLDRIGHCLNFPQAIPLEIGLRLEKRMAAESGLPATLIAELGRRASRAAEEELSVLRDFARGGLRRRSAGRSRALKHKMESPAPLSGQLVTRLGETHFQIRKSRMILTTKSGISTEDPNVVAAAVRALCDRLGSKPG